MKYCLMLLVSCWVVLVSGQSNLSTKPGADAMLKSSVMDKKMTLDTVPTTEYVQTKNGGFPPACFINGERINQTIMKTIDPRLIDSIHVEKKEIEIKGQKFYGQLFISMKKDYRPKLISLNELKKKYLKPATAPAVFMIDGEMVSGNYSNYMVDEKYILKIVVDQVENKEEGLSFELIRLLTRTAENIKKAQEIRIRGIEGNQCH